MKKIIFLCSGGGGNLKFVWKCINSNVLEGAVVQAVIADRVCGAWSFAVDKKIPAFLIEYNRTDKKQLMDKLREYAPDIIVTNFHKIIDEELVRLYDGKMINLHYSLLPAFKGTIGATPVKKALEAGCKVIGTTVHYVNADVDDGEIISQSTIPVIAGMPFAKLMDLVFRSGCINLLNSLKILLAKGQYKTANGDNPIALYPAITEVNDIFYSEIWEDIL